ncbi:MAG TPA: hypothetical protein VKE70_27045 [Candidatus Solibacter sp.]|nr:hypothetical protein [Candidatus Solibacter sp.]
MGEDERKHLEMIQAVVTRLAGNSFSIKGWAVGLIAILGGFAAKDADLRFASVLLFPALCFWGLDAYYLWQERVYRKLYEAAVKKEASAPLFSLNAKEFEKEVSYLGTAFSPTVLYLHAPILIFVIVLLGYISSLPPKPTKPQAHLLSLPSLASARVLDGGVRVFVQ